ncbi:hypothetical protein [Mycolicibacterium vinylchloridicum]|uniref:hypothetical protein n=1 Tax=Mycolicibacterium vinylchloridicum TaxID=2736928 RepID=UPI0015CD2401|nr:hypothetical protein [Mycolicibacterium vinylchloridicum]
MNNTIGRSRSFILGSVVAGALTVSALGMAGTAAAAPGGGSNAQDTVDRLSSQGYNVALNHNGGFSNVPLSECVVNGIHGLISGVAQGQPLPPEQQGAQTVYVDVNCSTNA